MQEVPVLDQNAYITTIPNKISGLGEVTSFSVGSYINMGAAAAITNDGVYGLGPGLFFGAGSNETVLLFQILTQLNPTCDLSVEFMNLMTSTVTPGCEGNPDLDAAATDEDHLAVLINQIGDLGVNAFDHINPSDPLAVTHFILAVQGFSTSTHRFYEPKFTPTEVVIDGVSIPVDNYDPQTGEFTFVTPAHAQGVVDVEVRGTWRVGPRFDDLPPVSFAQSFEFKTSASVNLQVKAYRDAARTIEIPQNGFIKHGTQIYWDFIVTNDGPEDLTDLTVTDTHITGVICTIDGPLAAGATQTCQTASTFE